MRPSPTLLLLAIAAATAADAQSGAKKFIAPSFETIVTYEEQSAGSVPATLIYVHNRSTVPIIVHSVALRDCENIKQTCAPRRLNLRVRPNARGQILRIEARDRNQGIRYRYDFGFRTDSSDVLALKAMAEAGYSPAQERLEAVEAASTARRSEEPAFVRDLWLTAEDLATLGDRVVALRAEPDSVVLKVDQIFLVRQVRVLAVDSSGATLGRVGALGWRVMPGVIEVRADTIAGLQAGRTTIEFRLAPPAKPLAVPLTVIVIDAPPAGQRD